MQPKCTNHAVKEYAESYKSGVNSCSQQRTTKLMVPIKNLNCSKLLRTFNWHKMWINQPGRPDRVRFYVNKQTLGKATLYKFCGWKLFRNIICRWLSAWWRHQKETFSALLTFCTGNSPVTGELPAQRPVTRSSQSVNCKWFEFSQIYCQGLFIRHKEYKCNPLKILRHI